MVTTQHGVTDEEMIEFGYSDELLVSENQYISDYIDNILHVIILPIEDPQKESCFLLYTSFLN